MVYGGCVGNALKWFPDRRGLAAGLTAAGFGAGSALTIIPIANVIKTSGNGADTPLVKSIAGSRATAPFIVDQHLAFEIGGKVQLFGDPNAYNNGVGNAGVRLLSWREVR